MPADSSIAPGSAAGRGPAGRTAAAHETAGRAAAGDPATVTCPGCGSVLVPAAPPERPHPGAAPACARLFEVTVRGLRDEADADPGTAAVAQLADDAYDAQHPVADDPTRLRDALDGLARRIAGGAAAEPGAAVGNADAPPGSWRTTIADVAADLDVIDLPVLVESWARTVHQDWTAQRTSAR
ncbi:DUF5946 family protein [Geodermatophilus sp. YIM 151500]|uniref:DUF5946 family protein n=1 Tax=Geodermatophilus sp. YIM 151500 TaxID=2984531 RepID=UPI0021E4AEE7|nr:DUF5946 family protein [Geodermatophilus sp. YIM 151500]MCV2490644.1 DUF5946 family protein [Geodermatophilus sp. YIM 151500]